MAANLNEEQLIAVQNIVEAKNFPLPYIIFGPPGTGKTRTIVSAIEEIVRSSDKYVLVCANSNAACDEIAIRLMYVLSANEMFRLYAKSCDYKAINPKLKSICNWFNDEFRYPSLSFLYRFRVLVCTLCTAGCLVRARHNHNYKVDHFSHIFIDECASTHETMAMIAIAGNN